MKEPKTLADLKPGDRVEAVIKLVVTDAGQAKGRRTGSVLVRPASYNERWSTSAPPAGARPGTPGELRYEGGNWTDGEPFFVPAGTEIVRALVLDGSWCG